MDQTNSQEAPANEPSLWYECLTCGFDDTLDICVYHLFEKHDGIVLMKAHFCVKKPVTKKPVIV